MESSGIRYYCFNKKCVSSIFSAQCVVTIAPFNADPSPISCKHCCAELISKEELNLKLQLGQIFKEVKNRSSFIIDDDPVYHVVVKKVFEHSNTFERTGHYMDGPGALVHLSAYQDQPDELPDVIFIDVNMPDMDAWEFLSEFAHLYPLLTKKVDVYVMTTKPDPRYNENIKLFPYVKGVIAKHFSLDFLDSLAVK